jgi:hypothetical protein
VLHVPGIEQFRSPYGISILEPVMAELRTRKVFEEASAFAERVIEDHGQDSAYAERVRTTIALSQRGIAASDERLGKLLWYPRDWVPNAREGLYFPGQELM